jgi:Leucine-rich repeat (LRR) protein
MEIAWTIVGIVATLLVGVGVSVLGLSPPEYTVARACFWVSASLMGGIGIVWELQTEQPTWWRICAGILIWVCVGVGLPESLRWVSKRQAAAMVNNPPINHADASRAHPSDDPVGNLSRLGWTVKRDGRLVFEIANSPLPNMGESEGYFQQIHEPFRLHFQSVPSLAGLEHLSRVEQCQEIEVNASDISGIPELAGFIHLKRLTLAQIPLNTRADIDSSPLAALINLESLTLYSSRFTDLGPIGNMTKLKSLSVGGTLIRDLSPIRSLHGLTNVDVRDSKVTDLSPLLGSRDLKELSIDGKQVANLARLSANHLEKLTVIEQGIVDLAPIGTLIHLDSLFIWGPRIMDLTFLSKLLNLSNLHISGIGFPPGNRSQVLHPNAICSSSSLKTLTLGEVQVSSLTFLAGCGKLAEINLGNVPVTSINEFSELITLKKVSLVDVPVVEISPLLSLPNLEVLNLIRVPARADVISALERKGVKVLNP